MSQKKVRKLGGVPLWSIFLLTLTLFVSAPEKGRGEELTPETDAQIQLTEGETNDDFDLFEDEIQEEAVFIRDPFERVNRAIFTFNDTAYYWVIKPVCKGYNVIAPTPVKKGVRNFFENLEFPLRFVNTLLQGKLICSGVELSRFLLNTTLGIGGLWDPSRHLFHLESKGETFGQTLGVYGIGNGFYIVLPFLGPSSLRDSVGLLGDSFFKPVSYVEPYGLSLAISSYKKMNSISFRIGDYEALKEAAIDPYNAFKDAYLKYMKHQVAE